MRISAGKFRFNSLWTKLERQGWVGHMQRRNIGIFEYEAGK